MDRRSFFTLFGLLPLLGLTPRQAPGRKKELRKVKILKDGEWVDANWRDLKKDVVFRMFESTGSMVVEPDAWNGTVMFSAWLVTRDVEALPVEQGSWCVQVIGHPEFIVT